MYELPALSGLMQNVWPLEWRDRTRRVRKIRYWSSFIMTYQDLLGAAGMGSKSAYVFLIILQAANVTETGTDIAKLQDNVHCLLCDKIKSTNLSFILYIIHPPTTYYKFGPGGCRPPDMRRTPSQPPIIGGRCKLERYVPAASCAGKLLLTVSMVHYGDVHFSKDHCCTLSYIP